MSFRQWDKEHGRRVKKGERAIWILAPRTRRVEDEAADGSMTSRTIVTGFTAVPVFNITQTEGPDGPGHPSDQAPVMCGPASSPDCGTAWPPRGTPTANRSCPTHGRRTAPGPSATPTRPARSSSTYD